MLQSAAETQLSIVYNCARNYRLPEYYGYQIPWARILSVWENSHNDGLRVTSKFLANTLSTFLDEEDSHLLNMSDSDLSSLLAALDMAACSADATAEAFGYSFSIQELLTTLQCIVLNANFKVIAKPRLVTTLTSIFQQGKLEEMISSLRILWNLLQVPELRTTLELSHEDLVYEVQKKSATCADEGFDLWSNGFLASMPDSSSKSMKKGTQIMKGHVQGEHTPCTCIYLCMHAYTMPAHTLIHAWPWESYTELSHLILEH